MKKSLIYGALSAALLLGAATVAGAAASPAIGASAEGVSGTITVDLTWGNWALNTGNEYGNGQNIAIYFWNSSTEESGWSTLSHAAHQQYLVACPYELTFTPTNMLAVRYSCFYDEETWETDPWCGGEGRSWALLGQTADLGFSANSNIIIQGKEGEESKFPATVGTAYVEGRPGNGDWDWKELVNPTKVRLNSENHAEYYFTIHCYQWTEFLIKFFATGYGDGEQSFSAYVDSKKWGSEGNNVKFIANEQGDFTVYFDRNDETILITDIDHDAADKYAESFLNDTNVCDPDGISNNITPEIWSRQQSNYLALPSSASRSYISEAAANKDGTLVQQCAARYDYIVGKYTKSVFTDFLDRNPAAPNGALANAPLTSHEYGNATLVVTFGITAILTSLAAVFYFRKRRSI